MIAELAGEGAKTITFVDGQGISLKLVEEFNQPAAFEGMPGAPEMAGWKL